MEESAWSDREPVESVGLAVSVTPPTRAVHLRRMASGSLITAFPGLDLPRRPAWLLRLGGRKALRGSRGAVRDGASSTFRFEVLQLAAG